VQSKFLSSCCHVKCKQSKDKEVWLKPDQNSTEKFYIRFGLFIDRVAWSRSSSVHQRAHVWHSQLTNAVVETKERL
jgi:hypothetical protein